MENEQVQSVGDAEAEALVSLIEGLSSSQLKLLRDKLGVPALHQKKNNAMARNLTEASRRAMQMGQDATHEEGFVPAFPEAIETACQQRPELRETFTEIWRSGRPLTHQLVEVDEELLQEYPVLMSIQNGSQEMSVEHLEAVGIQ